MTSSFQRPSDSTSCNNDQFDYAKCRDFNVVSLMRDQFNPRNESSSQQSAGSSLDFGHTGRLYDDPFVPVNIVEASRAIQSAENAFQHGDYDRTKQWLEQAMRDLDQLADIDAFNNCDANARQSGATTSDTESSKHQCCDSAEPVNSEQPSTPGAVSSAPDSSHSTPESSSTNTDGSNAHDTPGTIPDSPRTSTDTPDMNPDGSDKIPAGSDRPVRGGSGFAIADGRLTINGESLRGVAVSAQSAMELGAENLADHVISNFPGINVVRLSTSPEGTLFSHGNSMPGGQTIDDINQFIDVFNKKGIAVVIDPHGFDANNPNNVVQRGNEVGWLAQLAKDNVGNNMVMYQTGNEPDGSSEAVMRSQLDAYNAIRAVNPDAIVAFQERGGWDSSHFAEYKDVYNGLSNYVIDAHAYPGHGNTNPLANFDNQTAPLRGMVESDGTRAPITTFEGGESVDGSNVDPNSEAFLRAKYNDGNGFIAWIYQGFWTSDADLLLNKDGSKTDYGQFVADQIAAGAARESA